MADATTEPELQDKDELNLQIPRLLTLVARGPTSLRIARILVIAISMAVVILAATATPLGGKVFDFFAYLKSTLLG